jgi:hypothetical protein
VGMHRLLTTLVLAASLAGAAAAGAGGPGGGLYGHVTRGPTQPVCQVGKPCTGPASGLTLLFVRDGTTVGRTKTSTTGRYAIALAPGVYAVRYLPRGMGIPPRPSSVRVPAGKPKRQDFFIDTGIR